jgi:hypothetical protein
MRNEAAVDLQSDGIESHHVAFGHGHEDRNLRPGRVKQLFLQLIQFRPNAEDVGLDILNLLVQALRRVVFLLRETGCRRDDKHRNQHPPNDPEPAMD